MLCHHYFYLIYSFSLIENRLQEQKYKKAKNILHRLLTN